ncbi:MAG TPA: thioesterase family protein [Solirubrobacteraceae bacterium]|jgi:acyl-CoA thioesterase|nr:thioesterase family protein [Solirubrobacteraceae bacterium]
MSQHPSTDSSAFDAQARAERIIDSRWRAEFSPDVQGFGGVHGGYVVALGLRTMEAVVDDPQRPARSLTFHLLAPIRPGAVEILPKLNRVGNSLTSASIHIERGESMVAAGLAHFGKRHPGVERLEARAPEVPPPEDCAPIGYPVVEEATAGLLVEHRPAGPQLPLTGSKEARIRVWMRLLDDRPVDARSAAMLADAAPPALYATLVEPVAIPSVEIAIHFGDPAAMNDTTWVLGIFERRTPATVTASRTDSSFPAVAG